MVFVWSRRGEVELRPVKETGCKQEINKLNIEKCPRMDFLDLQQLDRWPNGGVRSFPRIDTAQSLPLSRIPT